MKKGFKARTMVVSSVLVVLSFVLKEVVEGRSGLAQAPAPIDFIAIFFMLATAAIAGFPIFKKAFGALRYRIIGIDALVTIAVAGAIAIGEFWEAAAVTYLFSLGDYLESRTIEKTRSSIKALLDLAPEKVRVRRNGGEEEISPDEVLVGDIVVVKPGEKIGVDGRVKDGSGYVDQATITGESAAVHSQAGSEVFSGTILESGYLILEAEHVGEDTSFARILHMVEEAQDRKAKTQKFLEAFSRWYTPSIVLSSVLLFIITKDIELALTLLVIACPGALVISAPVAIVAGIGNGAKRGFLVKGGDIMERLGKVKVVAFDKTGTLTLGAPRVQSVRSFKAGLEAKELLRLAALGEAYSEHPLAKAIIGKAREEGLLGRPLEGAGATASAEAGTDELHAPAEAELTKGKGLTFSYAGQSYAIGSRGLLRDRGVEMEAEQAGIVHGEESKGRTVVLIATETEALGFISIADAPRPEAEGEIAALRSMGIEHIAMLTGDNPRAAAAIAEELGIDEVQAELLPEDKLKAIDFLRAEYGTVAMVGDGVNDTPALAAADLGIAMGGVGSDVAMETADVVLVSANLSRLSYGLALSRATVRVMKQNIYFALGVAGLLLAGVLVKAVNLSFGMLVHEASVLLVILNAVRLLKFRQGSTMGVGRRQP